VWDKAHRVTARTGAEEVVIDRGTGLRPGRLSADFGLLVVQPGGEVGGIS
jgi:hypothetical protein